MQNEPFAGFQQDRNSRTCARSQKAAPRILLSFLECCFLGARAKVSIFARHNPPKCIFGSARRFYLIQDRYIVCVYVYIYIVNISRQISEVLADDFDSPLPPSKKGRFPFGLVEISML